MFGREILANTTTNRRDTYYKAIEQSQEFQKKQNLRIRMKKISVKQICESINLLVFVFKQKKISQKFGYFFCSQFGLLLPFVKLQFCE